MMIRVFAAMCLALVLSSAVRAADAASDPAALYERVSPAVLPVKYTWESELGRRELEGTGVVVEQTGLVMTPLGLFDPRIPDDQMRDFKLLVPRTDGEPEELDAVFLGRDERSDVAFLRTVEEQQWPAVEFVDAPLTVGAPLLSVGLMPKEAGYKRYLMTARVAAQLRGETPYVMVTGDLGNIGAPVFNAEGQAVGFVPNQSGGSTFLNERNALDTILSGSPRLFVPTRDFAISLNDPPTRENPIRVPWIGVPQQTMAGLNKDVAEMLGLGDEPAIELGDIIPGSPADKAGLQRGDIVLKVNGQPLQRGDQPEELPGIFIKQIRRIGVGENVTLTVLRGMDDEPQEITVALEERPQTPGQVRRFWAEDLGFGVREMTFADTYSRRLDADAPGVVVTLLKPNGSASNAQLEPNDLIMEMNGESIQNLEQFKTLYETTRRERPGDAVVMVVLRDAGTSVIRIEPPQ